MALPAKRWLMVAGSTAAIALGSMTALAPPSSQDAARERAQQERIEQLSEARRRELERYRRDGESLADAERRRALDPAVHASPDPPRLRIPLR